MRGISDIKIGNIILGGGKVMNERSYQIYTNCVMYTTSLEIKFDENGRCDFCNNYYNNILPVGIQIKQISKIYNLL